MVWFNRGKHILMEPSVSGIGEPPFDLDTDVMSIGLMKTTYSIDQTNHNQYADSGVSDQAIVATNYVEPGNASSNKLGTTTITRDNPNNRAEYDAPDLVFSSIGGAADDTFDQALACRELDSGASEANTELIAHFSVPSTITNGGNITLVWNTQGILQTT